MTSREYLQKVTLGHPAKLSGSIILQTYNPEWPAQYEAEQQRIAHVLNRSDVTIEHVGSTSVPGLCAKPIIDILLLVSNASDEASYIPALTSAGYTLRIREPEWYDHRMLKKHSPEVNLHVFSAGCGEALRMLDFRNHLRAHPEDLTLYAETKQILAQKNWKYLQDYADAKTSVIRKITRRILQSYPLRTLTEKDIPEMRTLFHNTISKINISDYTAEEVADWASCGNSTAHWQELLTHHRFFAVCNTQNDIIGFASVNSEGYLHSLYVHHEWQRIGVGTRLLAEVEQLARSAGAARIISEVSITARPLFEKQGFYIVKAQKALARRLRLTNFVMEKVL